MKGRRKQERKIVINHTCTEEAGDIRLKLLKLAARGTKEWASYYEEREAEQYRDLFKDKQR